MLRSKPTLFTKSPRETVDWKKKKKKKVQRQGGELRNYTSQTGEGRIDTLPPLHDNNSYRVLPLRVDARFYHAFRRNEGRGGSGSRAQTVAFVSTLLVRENNRASSSDLNVRLSLYLSFSLHYSRRGTYGSILSTSRGFSFQFPALRCFSRTTGFPVAPFRLFLFLLTVFLAFLLSRNCNIFSVSCLFKCNPGKTNDKFISIQRCHIDEFERERKRRIVVYEFGPQLLSLVMVHKSVASEGG